MPMMTQPSRQKTLPTFLLEYLIDQTMILGTVAGDAVQDEGAELEGKRPLPHFPEFVVVLALRPHDGNLVNGGVIEPDLPVNRPNGGLARFRVGDVEAHGARFEQH